MDIISQIKQSKLTGRGGAGFPTGVKWEIFKKAKAKKKYIICNASEGEPGILKDGHILEHYPEIVIKGIEIALKTFKNSSAYIYLRPDYYDRFQKRLKSLSKGLNISLFKKPRGGYLAGEETVVIANLENQERLEPADRPPFPCTKGLFGMPTLINNTETFYSIAKISQGEYLKQRFYSISGIVKNPGVYLLKENYSIEKVLKETNNYPNFDFVVQVGGGASGEILLPKELKKPATGLAGLIVFKRQSDWMKIMKQWADFFHHANCDKCTPCREGSYRLREMLIKGKINQKDFEDIISVLEQSSFCALGPGLAKPFESLYQKILKNS